jgi:hypothetical protein
MIDENPLKGLSKKDLKAMRAQKIVGKTIEKRVYGQILLAIPRHLLKMSIIIILGSFIFILYMMSSE